MTDEPENPPMHENDLNYPETLRLTLADADSTFEAARAAAGAFERGEDAEPEATRAFRDVADLRELLTDRRIAVLRSIYDRPPDSISDLADRLDRAYSLVHEDVTTLADHDVVHFREGPRGAKQPYVPYETIRVDIPLVGAPVTAGSMGRRSGEDRDRREVSGESG